jgi:hypothetical protein
LFGPFQQLTDGAARGFRRGLLIDACKFFQPPAQRYLEICFTLQQALQECVALGAR